MLAHIAQSFPNPQADRSLCYVGRANVKLDLSHPAISAVIPGIRNAEQAQCDLAVLTQQKLPQDILDRIARLWDDELCVAVRTSIGEEGEGERREEMRQHKGSTIPQ